MMALPVWARPYNRRAPHHLDARQRKYRNKLYEPIWYLFAIPFYGSLGLLAFSIPALPIILVGLLTTEKSIPPDVQMLFYVPLAWYVVMGTITAMMRHYFIDN